MYELYRRVKKDANNRGSARIEGEENPFLEGPCLLCVAAAPDEDSIFGMSKMGMMAAGLRVRENANAKFDIEGFPVDFLSLKHTGTDLEFENFVEKYFVPLISTNGEKLDVETAMKNMRNINIMSYCNGTITAQNIEAYMISKMHDLGYSEDEIEKIQSQMCVVSIATDRLNSPQKSNWIYFLDVNDGEVNDNVTPEDRKILAKFGEAMTTSGAVPAYLIDGNGEHGLKKQFEKGTAMSACLIKVVSEALKSSIASANGKFRPLTLEKLIGGIYTIIEQAAKGKTREELLKECYAELDYGADAKHLTDTEIELLNKLDQVYDELQKTRREKLKLSGYIESTNSQINEIRGALVHFGLEGNFSFSQEDPAKQDNDLKTGETREKLIGNYDGGLDYGVGANHLTDSEIKLLNKLEQACYELEETRRESGNLRRQLEAAKSKFKQMVKFVDNSNPEKIWGFINNPEKNGDKVEMTAEVGTNVKTIKTRDFVDAENAVGVLPTDVDRAKKDLTDLRCRKEGPVK